MGRIDEALQTIAGIEDETERALQLAGLVSTLFKIKGTVIVVTGELAFNVYAQTESVHPSLELTAFSGQFAPRTILEIMREQLHATGSLYDWSVAGISLRFLGDAPMVNRDLCRDFTTDHGVVKLMPVEEITADWILAAVHPAPDPDAQARAHQLLVNGLAEVFDMDWTALHHLCHRPEYCVGDELARMRLAAKKESDATGRSRDHVGETSVLPKIEAPAKENAGPASAPRDPSAAAETDETLPLGPG